MHIPSVRTFRSRALPEVHPSLACQSMVNVESQRKIGLLKKEFKLKIGPL